MPVHQSLSAKLREKQASMRCVCGCDEPTETHTADGARRTGPRVKPSSRLRLASERIDDPGASARNPST